MNITRTVLATGAIAAGAVTIAACGPTVGKTLPTFTPSARTAQATTFAPEPTSASPSPATSGPLGTSFTVTTTDDNDNTVVYTVTAVKVDQDTSLTEFESLATPGDHMAAVRFTIKGVTGSASDDANNDATVTGNSTDEYSASFDTVTAGPDFNSGTWTVGPGQTVSGWVAFEVPAGGSVVSVAWQPGLSGGAATWTVG